MKVVTVVCNSSGCVGQCRRVERLGDGQDSNLDVGWDSWIILVVASVAVEVEVCFCHGNISGMLSVLFFPFIKCSLHILLWSITYVKLWPMSSVVIMVLS